MSTNDDMSNVVNNASQFETRWFAWKMFILKKLAVWNKVSSISYHEHVTNVSVAEVIKNQKIQLNFELSLLKCRKDLNPLISLLPIILQVW